MQKLIIVTALVGTTMLVAPSTAGASYISGTDGTCILTDDGYVYFRGHVGTHGDSLGPFEWVFEWGESRPRWPMEGRQEGVSLHRRFRPERARLGLQL